MVLGRLQDEAQWHKESRDVSLTDREQELLTCLAQGLSNKEIEVQLKLSCQTVRNYLCQLYRKLGVANRGEAASWDERIEI